MGRLKVVLCGEGGVGKTALARAAAGKAGGAGMTVGADFHAMELGGERVIVWDVGGEERFRFFAPIALRGASGVLYVFDLTRPATLDALEGWVGIARRELGDGHPAVLVGNKVDLGRRVDREAAEGFAEREGMLGYVETSAKEGINVVVPFSVLVDGIRGRRRLLS